MAVGASHYYVNVTPNMQLDLRNQRKFNENCSSSNHSSPQFFINCRQSNHPSPQILHNDSPRDRLCSQTRVRSPPGNHTPVPTNGGTLSRVGGESGPGPQYTTIPSYPSAGSLLNQRLPHDVQQGELPVKRGTDTQRSYTTSSTNSVSVQVRAQNYILFFSFGLL